MIVRLLEESCATPVALHEDHGTISDRRVFGPRTGVLELAFKRNRLIEDSVRLWFRPGLSHGYGMQVRCCEKAGHAGPCTAVSEARIPTPCRHGVHPVESAVQRPSGKGVHVQGGVRSFTTRLAITDIDRRHAQSGTFDQPRAAVSDESVEPAEQTDECTPFQVIDHEET